ncbi:Muniscin C-terminal mu homology domain-containing protein [Mariannaea sp. PMI_226]|nr:Muniscin C-terminal mu homology domain-containing protein [Mariannaea sp. PMI_226]
MEDVTRTEYPAMLASIAPGQAVHTLTERVKRINRINAEIADWLQERRRVEEQYVQSLRKLTQFKSPNAQSELGVFQAPWNRILDSIESIAHSHHVLAERLERDIEHPLRNYHNNPDSQNMNTLASSLSTIARELEEAQDRSDKLSRKGGRANTQKVDAASSKLESASQQWEAQAPFIFESLQALDESRVNHLRDLLTQYQTHESDQAQRTQDNALQTLALLLEIDTEKEIQSFANKVTAGKAKPPTRTSTRQSSIAGTTSSLPPPPSTGGSASIPPPSVQSPALPHVEDDASEHNSVPTEPKPESKLRRLGTMFGGRRRQSMHAGFGQLSPQKAPTFNRLGTSHSGRGGVSPKPSTTNLQDHGRLDSLVETPDVPPPANFDSQPPKSSASLENANGVTLHDPPMELTAPPTSSGTVNGHHEPDVSDVPPPPGPPPSHSQDSQPAPPPVLKDSEGFTVPPVMNDPISEAQREAAAEAEESEQGFKLNIQQTPVEEEDPEEKKAALSSVANSLKIGPATRRTSTIRGRRDARHTVYIPPPQLPEGNSELSIGGLSASPSLPISFSKSGPVAALASEASIAATSDTQSVRSGNSLGSLVYAKHPEMTGPGLRSSLIETVSAVFENGEIKSASIAGEVAFVNNPSESGEVKEHEIIRINNFAALEWFGPNRIFVQNSSPDQHDQFSLDVSHLTKTATAFSYRLLAEDEKSPSLGQHAPLELVPTWKPQGDKLGLLLNYRRNPSFKATSPVTLHDVVFVVTYEGRATGAQTKPSGMHLKDKHIVYWRVGDVTLTDAPQKIVCRILGADGVAPTAGHVEAKWEYIASDDEVLGSGISISKLEEGKGKLKELTEEDPFADENPAAQEAQWLDVPMARKLVSGKYEGTST